MKKILVFCLIFLFATQTFGFAWGKKDNNEDLRGYKGTLPDLNKFFEYKRKDKKIEVEKMPQSTDANFVPKEAPFDDPIFMETIIKKPKNTPYVEDLLHIRPILIKFKDFLSESPENIDIQRYIARVNEIALLSDDIIKKYTQDYGLDPCYIWITSVSYRAKVLGNLMYERRKYSKYMDITTGEYSKPYIDKEVRILISELDKCIFRLMQLDVY